MYYKCMFSSSSKINSLDEENKKLLQTSKAFPADDGEVWIFKEMALFVQMFL